MAQPRLSRMYDINKAWNIHPSWRQDPPGRTLARIMKEIYLLHGAKPRWVLFEAEECHVSKIHIVVIGQPGTLYRNGFMYFLMKIPDTYPQEPPRVSCLRSLDTPLCIHPRVNADGLVRMDKTATGAAVSTWNPHKDSISTVANELQKLLQSLNNVVPSDEKWFQHVMKHETLRLAVCGVVDECLRADSTVPPNLRKQILANFLGRADYYVKEACELLHLNDQTLWDVIGDRPVKMEPRLLLSRLKDLLTKVLKVASMLDSQDVAEPK